MTEDQMIELAIQGHAGTRDAIRWAIRQEREECAKECDKQGAGRKALEHYAALTYSGATHDCATAIRSRS